MKKRTAEQRFHARYIKLDDGCWQWQGYQNNGYGTFCVNRHAHQAHCYSYVLSNGQIPEGMEIIHTCKNRACVNPEHLRAVPRSTFCKRGHPRIPENLIPDKRHKGHGCRMCNIERVREQKGVRTLAEDGVKTYTELRRKKLEGQLATLRSSSAWLLEMIRETEAKIAALE